MSNARARAVDNCVPAVIFSESAGVNPRPTGCEFVDAGTDRMEAAKMARIRSKCLTRPWAQKVPYSRGSATYSPAASIKLLLCAVCCALTAVASAQIFEGQVLLPDSLGPLPGKIHVAFDDESSPPRMFLGSEDGDVLVVNTLTCEKLARVRTGPVAGLCYSPPHNKLYVSKKGRDTVAVVDCSAYEVVATFRVSGLPTSLIYNGVTDRVYCGARHLKVIDCALDTVVDTVDIYGTDANFALDTAHNKLYVGTLDAFKVLDCSSDSVISSIAGLRRAEAVCLQPTAGKVYVAAGESLFALSTESDSVVYRQRFDTLTPQLACDPEHNRVYYTYRSNVIALDCARDSVVWTADLWARAIGLAAVPAQDKLYMTLNGLAYSTNYVLDGATGQTLQAFELGDVPHYSAAANRVLIITEWHAVTVLDCTNDTVVGVMPLLAYITSMCMDSADNKLYFSSAVGGGRGYVGTVDCSSGKVKSQSIACHRPGWLTHNSVNNRLYCSGDSSIFVFDCTADTVVKVIPIGGSAVTMNWHPLLNKLYAVVVSSETVQVVVIDCATDTIAKTLGLRHSQYAFALSFLASDYNQFWVFNDYGHVVVDCLRDSIVTDTFTLGGNCWSVCYSPNDRKVYAVRNRGLYVVDMDTRLPIDSLPTPPSGWPRQAYCATRAGKVYWVIQNSPGPDSVFAVDTQIDSIVSRFAVPFTTGGVCEDRTGDYVYFASGDLVVVDTRADSVVSGVHLPLGTEFLIRNSETNRLYVAGLGDSVIQVVYDSVIVAGMQAGPDGFAQAARARTLVCRSEPLRCTAAGVLFDASGRRVAVLQPGLNDIGRLMRGVYFVREASGVKREASSVQKVLVVR
jgi:DNA-binding beta-propeller fold protein YncE